MTRAATKLGQAVRQALGMRGVSQAELSRRLKVDPAIVNRWVQGTASFDHDDIARIEEALGLPAGMIASMAGYSARARSTRDALVAAPELGDAAKVALLEVFDAMVDRAQREVDRRPGHQ